MGLSEKREDMQKNERLSKKTSLSFENREGKIDHELRNELSGDQCAHGFAAQCTKQRL